MKFPTAIFLALYLLIAQNTSVYAQEMQLEFESPPSPQYSAGAVVLMDAATGLVLYGYNATTQMYPASITKIMTALVVLENSSDLTERIEFSHNSIWSIPRLSTHIAMDEGETLTIYEALHALLMSSANEVSIALAEHTAGSVEAFVNLMNRRAVSLGALGTNFVNPSGLPGIGHVTTAYDMSLIMREAIRNPVFRQIISTVRFDIPPTERQAEVRHLLNDHRMIRSDPHFNEYVVGGKTGFTNAAGSTLVTYAYNGSRHLIVTVLNGEAGAFGDTAALLDYGFAMPFRTTTVFDATTYALTSPVVQIINGNYTEIGTVNIRAEQSLTMELPPGFDATWLRYELHTPETLTAPVLLNDNVGRVEVFVQNIRVGSVPLRAQEAVLPYIQASDYYTEAVYEPIVAAIYDYILNTRLSFLDNEYILTLAIPLAISAITLIIALIVYLTRRKKRMRRALHNRYARYPDYYRYK